MSEHVDKLRAVVDAHPPDERMTAYLAKVHARAHTVTDDEPKYGICVTGTIHPDRILTKAGARAGDRLYLTKAIGTGIVLTALMGRADPA